MTVPTDRIIARLDSLVDARDFSAAKRHLEYWEAEAVACGDERGLVTIYNELIGFYRKNGYERECTDRCGKLVALIESLGLGGSVTGATSLLNCATGLKTFGRNIEAVSLYEKARAVYEKELPPDDTRLAGLYNNLAVALAAVDDFAGAESNYKKALGILADKPDKAPETAVTYLNMVDLVYLSGHEEDRLEDADGYLRRAKALLDSEQGRDGNYAFVLEKCYPVFEHYGYLEFADELKSRSEMIYEELKNERH